MNQSNESADEPADELTVDRHQLFGGVRRLVVKVGTNVLSRESGELALGRTQSMIEDIVDLRRAGYEVIVVSSGAIGMGLDRLGLDRRPTNLPDLQACAAVGQIRLMSVYDQGFSSFGITAAQVLLTEDDFADRERYLNIRHTLDRLLERGVVPIINENDTVSTSEIEPQETPEGGRSLGVFGDNDRLSALVMSKLEAGLLILLSDVDGLYQDYDSPATHHTGPISVVEQLGPEIQAMAREGNARGRGGMTSKLRSIEIAVQSGGMAVIANGTVPGVLPRVLAGEDVGTLFLPGRRVSSRKRWLAHASAPSGHVRINAGAVDALCRRQSSLLFAGVVTIEGDFKKGDIVALCDENGREIGRGRVNYSADTARPLLGKRSDEVAEHTGERPLEFVHRDHIAMLESGA